MVAPCRRFVHAARWNGQAPQATTGTDSTSESHSHPATCSAGTIASRTTGTVSTALTSTRRSRSRVSSAGGFCAGGVAAYPASCTVATRSSVVTAPGWETRARSVA